MGGLAEERGREGGKRERGEEGGRRERGGWKRVREV